MASDTDLKPVTQRAEEMAAANDQLIEFVESCSDDDWATVCAGEGWPVGVVAYHAAKGHGVVAQWIDQLLAGGVAMTADELNAMNATMAREHANVSRTVVVELSRTTLQALTATLLRLTDDDLRVTGPFGPAGGSVVPVDAIAGSTGHVMGHLASMRSALGR